MPIDPNEVVWDTPDPNAIKWDKKPVSSGAKDYALAFERGLAPYLTSATVGATVGGGIGGPPGAFLGGAAAPIALGLTDLTLSGYNALAGAFGWPQSPYASEAIKNLMVPERPQGTGARILEATTEAGAGGLGFARGAQAFVNPLAEMTTGQLAVRELAKRPGTQAAAGAASGAAVQAARESGVENPLALTALGFAAGVPFGVAPYATQGTANFLLRTAQNFAEPFMTGGTESIKARAFLEAFQNNPQQMQMAAQLLRQGYTPEQAAVKMGNTGFAALISSSRRSNPLYQSQAAAAEAAAAKSQANRAALAKRELELTQQGLDRRAAQEQARQEMFAESQQEAVRTQQSQLGGQVGTVDPVEVGTTLTTVRKKLIEDLKPKIKALYEKAFSLAPEKFSFAEVEAAATKISNNPATALNPTHAPYTAEAMRLYETKIPPDENVLVGPRGERLSPEPKPQPAMVSLREADTFLHAVNKDLDNLHGLQDAGANATRKNLMKLKVAAQQAIDAGISGDAKTAYRNASETWRTQLSEPFRQGWVTNLERVGATNTPILAPHKVTAAALESTDTAARFVRAFGKSAEAKSALRRGIEEMYRKTVVNKDTGVIDPAKHADFMDTYGRQIDVLDQAGVNVRSALERFGQEARRLRTEEEIVTESGKGISGRVKEQYAPEQAEIDRVVALANRAASKITSAEPKESISRIDTLTRTLPEIRRAVGQILAEVRQQRRFEELARRGESAGGDVLGLVSESTGKPPMSLTTMGSIVNYLLRTAQGKLNPKLAAEIAAETFNAAGLARLIEGAPTAAVKTGKLSPFGRAVNAPVKKVSLPGITINALMGSRPNTNALAEQ